MSNTLSILSSSEPSGIGLKSYNVSLPMGTLAIGVDNIHHDVFLSPKFVQAARDYLLDLIRQHTNSAQAPGMEPRQSRGPDSVAFRKLLSELLQSSLTQAKYHKNIEIDLLFRLSLLKFLASEIGNQFANIILDARGANISSAASRRMSSKRACRSCKLRAARWFAKWGSRWLRFWRTSRTTPS